MSTLDGVYLIVTKGIDINNSNVHTTILLMLYDTVNSCLFFPNLKSTSCKVKQPVSKSCEYKLKINHKEKDYYVTRKRTSIIISIIS